MSHDQALEQWKEDLRRKVVDEHVDVAVIVQMLNAKGFKVNARDVRNVVTPGAKRPRKAAAAKSSGSKKRGDRGQTRTASAPRTGAGSASFKVEPDGDDT